MRAKPGVHRHTPSSKIAEPLRSFALLRDALARHDAPEATMIFEQLNATHWIPRRPDLVPWLNRELGAHATELLVQAFATLPCHFCRGEWGRCPTCEGRGEDHAQRACKTCAGIALGCCAACNGSGLANYSTVPVGLRHAVLKARLATAATLIRARSPKGGSKAGERIGARLPAILAGRAMLANAVRAASEGAPSFVKVRDAIPRATKQRVRKLAVRLAADAEIALRACLADMSELERAAAERGGVDADAARRRASRFQRIAGRKIFVSPPLYRKALAAL